MNRFRGAARFLVFVILALYFLTTIVLNAVIVKDGLPYALRRRRKWARVCSRMVGVSIEVNDPPGVDGPVVYIGNHRSYYDPVAVLRDVEALPVAKAEIGNWPLIGFAARATGVMFVRRESKESRRQTVEAIEETLKGGHSVLIYPEGTTHTDLMTMPFRPGAFRVAAEMGVPVIPIAIEYKGEEDAWVGSDVFIPHFLKVFGKRKVSLRMRYGQPIRDDDPERLMQRTREWIDRQIGEMRRGWWNENIKNGKRATPGTDRDQEKAKTGTS